MALLICGVNWGFKRRGIISGSKMEYTTFKCMKLLKSCEINERKLVLVGVYIYIYI